MEPPSKTPVDHGPTMCSVCAWRRECLKKFSYQQGSALKCPEFTRDVSLPARDKE